MKKLDWTAVTASNGLVFEEQTFEHINNGHKDSYISFVKANIPSAWHTGKLVILYGCVDSGTPPARNLSAGAVYYNGEIYQVDSASFTTTGLDIGIWTLVDVDSGSTESTIKTATSSFLSHVLVNSKFVFAAGLSGSGTFDESSSDIVNYDNKTVNYYSNLGLTTRSVTTSYVTRYTYTTPNDGIIRSYFLHFNSIIDADLSSDFRYKTDIFLNTVSNDPYEVTVRDTTQVSYSHTKILVNIDPNTTIELKESRETLTDGSVRRDKISIFSI